MEERFYTIDQIAEILGMHHKTIRKFITEGRLRANKVGKQWRIAGHDLSDFMETNKVKINNKSEVVENEKIEFSTGRVITNKENKKIKVSTVVDVNEIDSDEYKRISNMLLAVMNTKNSKVSNSTINMKYYEKEENLKVMLWGEIEFIKEILDFIAILIENSEK